MGATILLLEDNAHILKINREALSAHGYSVLEAETISKGSALLEQHSPDLLICDIMLPDGNGIAFYRALRSIRNVPCLFLSSKARDNIPWGDMDTRYVDFLGKPYRLSTLLERVETLLSRASDTAYDEQLPKLSSEHIQTEKARQPIAAAVLDASRPTRTRRKTPRQRLSLSAAGAVALVIIAVMVFTQSELFSNEPQDIPYVDINEPGIPLAAPPTCDMEQANNGYATLILKHTECMQVSATAHREDCGLHVFRGIADGKYMIFALLPEGTDTESVEIGKLVVTNGSADLLIDRDNETFWQSLIEIRP